jgi:hypothetical protein
MLAATTTMIAARAGDIFGGPVLMARGQKGSTSFSEEKEAKRLY